MVSTASEISRPLHSIPRLCTVPPLSGRRVQSAECLAQVAWWCARCARCARCAGCASATRDLSPGAELPGTDQRHFPELSYDPRGFLTFLPAGGRLVIPVVFAATHRALSHTDWTQPLHGISTPRGPGIMAALDIWLTGNKPVNPGFGKLGQRLDTWWQPVQMQLMLGPF